MTAITLDNVEAKQIDWEQFILGFIVGSIASSILWITLWSIIK